MTDEKSDKLALYTPPDISDAVTPEEAIESLHAKTASLVNNGYRDYTQLSPKQRAEFADYLRRMADYIAPKPAKTEIKAAPKEIPLAERIKRVYPVIQRAYKLYLGTGQCSPAIADEGTGASLFVGDNFYNEPTNSARSACVNIDSSKGRDIMYSITAISPEWKRLDKTYTERTIEKVTRGRISRLFTSSPTIDVSSRVFKIDCKPLPEFITALSAGGDKLELRQATLEHLLSLPEILTPHLDRVEHGRLVK